jgi:Kdo2-lipid IVA lauroyltransferase/acyltransferase
MKNSPFHPIYWPSWLALGLLRLWVSLPFSWIYYSGKGLGWLMDKTLKGRRHVVEVNIGLCFPELTEVQQDALVSKTMQSTALGLLETAYSWWASDAAIINRSQMEGLEHIDKAKEEGRGVLMIGAHYTTLDLSGRVFGSERPCDVIYRPQGNEAFDYIINSSRNRHLGELIDKRDMRKMVKRLKQGHTVWYASDQDLGPRGAVFAPFFGIPTATITTIRQLVKLSGAKVVFYAHYRIDDGGNSRYVGKVLDVFDEKLGTDDIEDARQINKVIEDSIRPHPEQYLWVHRRFKTRPSEQDPDFYARFRK